MKDIKVLIAHHSKEEDLAKELEEPIRAAGYEVAHQGTILVGESFTQETLKILNQGSPVVLCGTSRAIGTKWTKHIVNAAKNQYRGQVRVFCLQMDEDADVESVGFNERIALYWQDRIKATDELIASLKKYYPLNASSENVHWQNEAEQRYRKLALESCDIIDLVNLPESDRHIATTKLALRRLYVALRVEVEISASAEVDESQLEIMEKRRSAKQFLLAGRGRLGRLDESEWEDRGKRVPIGERLAEAKRLVVLGDPGAGKTTMVRWMTTAYLLRLKQDPDWQDLPDVKTLPNEDWLPIIIRCRDLDKSSLGGSLDDMLSYTLRKEEMTQQECSAVRHILQKKLQDGSALLLIDGLDEITDPGLRITFCRQIERICNAHPKAPIIVTSRIVGYREMKHRIGREFEHVTVADLTREDKDDFAHRWCNITELPERKKKAAEELIKDIHSSDRIERLTGNPMLLTTMALVKRKVGKLPSRRADLYWEAVQVLLNWRREVDEPIDYREAVPQLNYIAYAMCDRGVQQLREDEIIELLEQIRQERPENHMVKQHTPEKFLHLLEHRTGILVQVGDVRHNGIVVPVFEFRHLTFQEYLAGLALVQGYFPQRDRSLSLAQHIAPLAGRISEVSSDDSNTEVAVTENWREALRLCVASCNDDDVDEVLQAILKPLEGEDAETTARARAVMAALCLADEPNASDEIAREVLQEFTRQIGESEINQKTETSVQTAVTELAVSRWADMLGSYLLKEFQKQDALSWFICGMFYAVTTTALIPDIEKTRHQWFLEQVSKLGLSEEESIGAAWNIVYLVTNDKTSDVLEMNVSQMIDGLLKMLTGRPPAARVAACVLSLLNREQQEANAWRPQLVEMEQLISFIKNPKSDSWAIACICSVLGQEGTREAAEPLIFWLDDPHKDLRKGVAIALGDIKDIRAVEPLIAKLDDSDKDVLRAVAIALGQIKDIRAVEQLITKLDDSDKDVRDAVAWALGEIKDKRAVEPLIAKLDDLDEDVRYAVAQALGQIKDIRAVEPLITKLDDLDKDVRYAVAWALGEIKDQRAVEPLIAKLDDSEKGVRQAVVKVLGEIKDIRAVEPLIAKLDDSEKGVRYAVAIALGEIKDIRAVEPLIAKLDDSDEDVRYAVAIALGEIKDIRAVEPLIAKLDDSDENVRRAVAWVLGEIKDIRAVESLIAKLDDSDKDVLRAVAIALGEIKDIRAVEPLITKLDDSDKDVRYAVAWALGEIKDIRAVEPLIAKLDDSDKDVRYAVAIALGKIKDQRAVEPLIAKLDDSDKDVLYAVEVRYALEEALVELEHTETITVLFERLSSDEHKTRVMALEALSPTCKDEVDRKLLSRNLDAFNPFLDPQEEIDEERVRDAAEALEISVEEVRSRYQALAQQFPLKLNFADAVKD
ncbi:HEAT repeat domain-containing protein [Brasilonema sp. CT11]|nr:HEAT repeat domain-containing protein [Brasilonema sp. CT11]